MKRRFLLALACLLLSGCETVSAARSDGAYAITARHWPLDVWPSESLLMGKAAALCPTGYQRLGARSGDNESFGGGHFIEWRIRCSDGRPAASAR
jgi:hypothetical protein